DHNKHFNNTIYCLKELETHSIYEMITRNVKESDATLILFHEIEEYKLEVTVEIVKEFGKQLKIICLDESYNIEQILNWISDYNIRYLYITGSEEILPGVYQEAYEFIYKLLKMIMDIQLISYEHVPSLIRLDSDDVFSNIKYSEPVATISDKDCMKIEDKPLILNDFISVHSTIFQRPLATEYAEAEQLYSLLKEYKDKIDNILNSQHVYAIGPAFQEDYSMPCITCWVAKSLNKSAMEKISAMFDDKFRVVYHLVNAENITDSCNNQDKITCETLRKDSNELDNNIPR
ncbi:7205_t:CDS:2, partial [Scutellospora calospora]